MKRFRTRKGFTLVEIMIVVAIIGILMAIAVPGFVKARTTSRLRACNENLVKIDGAKGNDQLCVSVGVAGASEEMSRPDEVILLADKALYMAKESGRNTCTVYEKASPLQKS